MKSLLIKFIVICIILPNVGLAGQDWTDSQKNSWSIVVSYNPMIAGTFSNDVTMVDGNTYIFGGDVGVQYIKSNR